MLKPLNKQKHITIKQPPYYQIMFIVCLIIIEIYS